MPPKDRLKAGAPREPDRPGLLDEAEGTLKENRARYQDLIETISDFIWEIDPEGRYTYCSPQMETLWGIKPESMIGKTPFDQMPPGPKEAGIAFYQGIVRSRSPFRGVRVPSLDGQGKPITIEISGVPFFDDRGELLGYRGVTHDVTESERTQKELLSRGALLSALTDNSPDAIYVKDTQSRWLMANPAVLRIIGKSAEEALGKTDRELYADPEIGKAILENDRRILEGRKAETFEELADTPDGRRLFLSMKAPWFDAQGQVVGMIGISHDITEHAVAEKALRESEERYRLLVQHAPAGIFELDLDAGRFTEVNEVVCRILGYSRDEFLAMDPFDLMDEDGRDRLLERIRQGDRVALNAEAAEYRVRRKDGEFVWALVNATYQRVAGVAKRATVVAYDISDRKRAEQALGKSEKKFRDTFESSPIDMALIRLDGTFIDVNAAAVRMHGYASKEELLAKNCFELVDPEYHKTVAEAFAKALACGHVNDIELVQLRKDGQRIHTLASATVMFDPEGQPYGYLAMVMDITARKRADELRQALAEQDKLRLGAAVEQASDSVVMADLDGRIRYVNAAFESINKFERKAAKGTSYFDLLEGEPDKLAAIREAVAGGHPWRGALIRSVRSGRPVELEVAISPAMDAAGAVVGGLITEKDVTQENALQRQLRHAQKMEALGTLAGGITHDFNNILGAIVLSTELALLDLEPGHPAQAALPTALKAANRGKELVRQIITFSRQREWEKRAFELGPVVRDALGFLRATLPKTITIEETLPPGAGAIFGDPSQFNQIVVNLCQNAAQAIKDNEGLIQVKLEPVQVEEAMTAANPDLKTGPYVRLTVGDNGSGISPEIMERIFEPFFTTRKSAGGTGLGLAVVHGIVKNHGGAITVASESGRGTVFSVYVPRWDGEVVAIPEPKYVGHNGHGERVLLVEDDASQRNTLSGGLRRMGYKVISKPSGSEALETFRTTPSAYDIVITDQLMPGMSGLDMAAEIFRLRSDIPIILCTGFSERVDQMTVGRNGIRELIMKPFTLRELSQLIRRTLRGSSRRGTES